ncbi:Rha family transcriptional regulator [Endozoicomonas sp. SESOKO1]|uniref:Rha family transcriptional regulator n=1 Tax=Endozoicomonas sp. SESOKO1 TaxID=2828742 RepID=UPI002148C88C|nr:Rha family transcriptional regulator [Endozoicomonas sp. SESOKO1]
MNSINPFEPTTTTVSNAVETMSSREITELTGKNHADVMRDIKSQLGQLGDLSKFAGIYLDSMNNSTAVATIDQATSMLEELGLISNYIDWGETFGTKIEYVEGKALLDAMGISYTDRNWTSCLKRINEQNHFEEDKDFTTMLASEFHAHTDVCMESSGNRAKVYIYKPHSAAEAVLSAHTSKGKQSRMGIIQKTVAQHTALTTIAEVSSEEDVKAIAQAGLTGSVHDVMALSRPSKRIAKLVESHPDKPLDDIAQEFIDASYNNPNANYDDRVRFAESLRNTLTKIYDKKFMECSRDRAKALKVMAEIDAAEVIITKYERKLARQAKTLAENKLTELEAN